MTGRVCVRPARILFLLILVVFSGKSEASPVYGGVVINEIYYDHAGGDGGWEFIELFNSGMTLVDIGGWRLEFVDGRTGTARTVWEAAGIATLAPEGYLLIGGSERTDDPDLALEGNLENGPDGARLIGGTGTIDMVAYGEPLIAGLCEGDPAIDVPAGSSLSRKPDGVDTDNNREDFVMADPTPGVENFFDYDIAPHISGIDILRCRSVPFDLVVILENVGTGEFIDAVTVDISIGPPGDPPERVSRLCELALEPGKSDSFSVTLLFHSSWMLATGTVIYSAMDTNASNDSSAARLSLSPGPLVVNEIMYRPYIGNSEWIELFNSSEVDLDLQGWHICDGTGSKKLISAGRTLVAGGGWLILADDPECFLRAFPSCVSPVLSPEGGWSALNDSEKGGQADEIGIFDLHGTLVEKVVYHDMLNGERGRSIERYSPAACSESGEPIWHRCSLETGATPGKDNSVLITSGRGGRGMSISPNPFCPGCGETAVISCRLIEGETGFRMTVFDIEGFGIRKLYAEDGGAKPVSCRWDGRSDGGRIVPDGLYPCAVEYVGPGGGVCRREKCCIAVGGGS